MKGKILVVISLSAPSFLLVSCTSLSKIDPLVAVAPDCTPSVLRKEIAAEAGSATVSTASCVARLTAFGSKSVWEVWDRDGTPRVWVELLDCRLFHGRYLRWSANGNLIEEKNYRHGRPHGEQRKWYASSGRLRSRTFWNEGKEIEGATYDLDGVFWCLTCGNRRGNVTLSWNREGELSVCAVFWGDRLFEFSRFGASRPSGGEALLLDPPGQIDNPALPRLLSKLRNRLGRETESLGEADVRLTNLGALLVWEVWGKDGRPLERAELLGTGILHGRYQQWSHSAKLLFDCNYDTGKLSGEQRTFHESGGLKCFSIWRDGHEVERETYAENGALRGVVLGQEEGQGKIDILWDAAGELVRCTILRLGVPIDFTKFGPASAHSGALEE